MVMSNGLPENNRERNAYHEAGHVVLAWRLQPKSIGGVELGEVISRSRIAIQTCSPLQRTVIAVAGALAEAWGISRTIPEGNFEPVGQQIVFHINRRLPDYGAQWLDIPLRGGRNEQG